MHLLKPGLLLYIPNRATHRYSKDDYMSCVFYIAIQPINNVVMGSCLEGDQLSQLSGTEEQKKVEFTGDWS